MAKMSAHPHFYVGSYTLQQYGKAHITVQGKQTIIKDSTPALCHNLASNKAHLAPNSISKVDMLAERHTMGPNVA